MGQKAKPERCEGRWNKMFSLYSVRTPRKWSVTLLALLACLAIGVSGLAGSTTTTVDSSPNPSVYGQTITFTVTVSGVQTPSGTVTLKDGSTTLGTKDLATEGTATVTFTSSDLGAGTHTIMAEYSGYSDYGYDPSTSDPVYQTVNKASTEVTVEADVNPSVTGQEVTFTATVAAVSPGAGTPTGTVIFYVNNVAISSGISLDSNGKASCTYTFDAAGSYSITVEYSGDDNYTSSDNKASPYSQAVNPADTSVTVDSSQDPSVTGQPVTFTATVEASGDGSGTPTGTVTFYKGDTTTGTPICTDVPLNNAGKASCTTALNAADADASNHIDISVEYSGDSNFNSSTGTYQQTVNPADTSVTLSSSNNPANVGDPITFTATVSVDSPGAGTPTGTVTFTVNDKDGTQVATSTENLDNSGAATYDISTLDASGSPYAVTAEYNGDSNFNASTSSSLTQLVKTDSTTTVSLTSPSGTPVTGESVTFTATVSASGITPTGTVTFTITDKNNTQVASSTEALSGGSATFTTTALKAEGSDYTV
ncbi:Ig-like domain repeat protein, partial [Candidatus Bipolaricaulota bacterium]|nr:Ig-like domain repeat protein [Candidatus Bipolaricaulota bacterium]